MPYTQRGQAWELIQSWWILFTFFPLLNWIGFMYAGLRARKALWLWYGVAYLAAIGLLFTGILGLVYLLTFGGAIYHAFVIRGEYLQRLDALIRAQPYADDILRQRQGAPVSSEVGRIPPASTPQVQRPDSIPGVAANERQRTQPASAPDSLVAPVPPAEARVDINNAPEEALARLPGLTALMARRVVGERQARHGFESAEELGRYLELQPHQVARLREQCVFNEVQAHRHSGRVID